MMIVVVVSLYGRGVVVGGVRCDRIATCAVIVQRTYCINTSELLGDLICNRCQFTRLLFMKIDTHSLAATCHKRNSNNYLGIYRLIGN